MQFPFRRKLATATALVAVVCTAPVTPQLAQGPSTAAPQIYPAPTNLKVLPKDVSGAQLHEIMEQWKQQLSMDCNACHKEDTKSVDADGRPILNFADDSKPEKRTARVMYAMTEDINVRYLARIDSSGTPVTCGTCHRGHVGPEPMVFPLQESKVPSQNSATSTESTKQQ